MSLVIKTSKELVDPANFKLKILAFGMYGLGKTTFMATAPKLGAGVCETGHGSGLLSVASKEFEYAQLQSYADFDAFCSGTIFKDKETLGLDSLSEMARTFIRDKALSIPRAKGESQKRAMGVPELDDYGVIGELTRKLIRKLLDQPKHIVVTAGLRIDKPDPDAPTGETLIGPDLAGQMFLGSTAMFDLCLCVRSRSVLRDPKDAKSRFTQRYWLTENNGSGILAKNRLSVDNGKSFLPTEVNYDLSKNEGTFDYFYQHALDEYKRYLATRGVSPNPKTI